MSEEQSYRVGSTGLDTSAALDRLNRATFDELRAMRLSVTQANRLIAHREQQGGFQSLDELDGIAGFSQASVEDFKETLAGVKPVMLNWAREASVVKRPVKDAGSTVPLRRRPRRDGVLLALAFFVALPVVVALYLDARYGTGPLSGASMILVGVGAAVAFREVGDVSAHLDLLRWRTLQRVLALIWGVGWVIAGVARIGSG
jgi:hypothetical protein